MSAPSPATRKQTIHLNFVKWKQWVLTIFLLSFWESVLIWFLNQCRVYIISQLRRESIFPDEWKSARVTPLYKNEGKRSDMTNYSPISIIQVVAKIFECIIYDQLYKNLTDSKLLSSHQSAFILLTLPLLLCLNKGTESWSLNIDQGNINAIVFLDLKKAFDTVHHTLLLSKTWLLRYDRPQRKTGSVQTLVVIHSPVQLATVSRVRHLSQVVCSRDHFRPLIICILHKWLSQLSASLSSKNVHWRHKHYLC